MKAIVVISVLLGFCTNHSLAYEIDTHSRITQNAYLRSGLFLSNKLVLLGLAKARKKAPSADGGSEFRPHLGLKYYDPVKTDGPDRYATDYDALNSWVMKEYKAPQPQRRWTFSAFDSRDEPYFPVDWMARGAVREDDTKAIFALKAQYWDGERNAALSLDFGFKELPA